SWPEEVGSNDRGRELEEGVEEWTREGSTGDGRDGEGGVLVGAVVMGMCEGEDGWCQQKVSRITNTRLAVTYRGHVGGHV
ncbi:hypothetical protein O988_04825, partial [Pseudogymnoascus sp. VKM F-3808]